MVCCLKTAVKEMLLETGREVSSAVEDADGEGVFLADAEFVDGEISGLSGGSDDIALLEVGDVGPVAVVDRAVALEPSDFVAKNAGRVGAAILRMAPCEFKGSLAVIGDFGFEVVDGVGGGGIDDDDVWDGGGFLIFVGDFDADLVFTFLEGESGEFDGCGRQRHHPRGFWFGLVR